LWVDLSALKNGVFTGENVKQVTELLPKRGQFLLNIGFIHPAVVNWQRTHFYIRSTSTLSLVPSYTFL
jgi:hypothetical protein